jgi:hypothetical protein
VNLYTDITTDQLWSLCSEWDKPSKLAKLKLIKILRIQYVSKYEEATYKTLRPGGGWEMCGLLHDEDEDDDENSLKRRTGRSICNDELEELLMFTGEIRELGPGRIFPNLHTIAISSIFANHYWGESDCAPFHPGVNDGQLCMS